MIRTKACLLENNMKTSVEIISELLDKKSEQIYLTGNAFFHDQNIYSQSTAQFIAPNNKATVKYLESLGFVRTTHNRSILALHQREPKANIHFFIYLKEDIEVSQQINVEFKASMVGSKINLDPDAKMWRMIEELILKNKNK